MAVSLSSPKECRNAYRELLQGYSHVEKEGYYIKHFKESDLGFIEGAYQKCFNESREKGLFTRSEKIKLLKDQEVWNESLDDDKIRLTLAVKEGYEITAGMGKKDGEKYLKEHVEPFEKELEEVQKELISLIEPIVETYCEKVLNEQYVYYALYKDEELKNLFYTREEYSELSFIDIAEIVQTYNKSTSKFSEKNINKIGANHFFLNPFFMCEDDPVKFYGKNILDLTMYQLNLFTRGKFCKMVLSEGKEPPEEYYSENTENGLDKLVSWYELAYTQIKNEREQKNRQARHQRAQNRGGYA